MAKLRLSRKQGEPLLSEAVGIRPTKPWVVLSVDDEVTIHDITRMMIEDFHFEGRPVALSAVTSGREAMAFMAEHRDVALILLDVVMEQEDSGLEVARYVREELQNHYTRIVLRTGQPGQAPEEMVIRTYDIDGYSEKTDLCRQQLYSVLYSRLRAYRDICSLQRQRSSMEGVVHAIANLNSAQDLASFAAAILTQISTIISDDNSAIVVQRPSAYAVVQQRGGLNILAASGDYVGVVEGEELITRAPGVYTLIQQVLVARQDLHLGEQHLFYYHAPLGQESVVYINSSREISEQARSLLGLFATNIAITHQTHLNRCEFDKICETHSATLSTMLAYRDRGVSPRVARVDASQLAQAYGIAADVAALIGKAAHLHGLGKMLIPDDILQQDEITAAEWQLIRQQAQVGYEMLHATNSALLIMIATITQQQHERWDGQGAPQGLKGEAIDVAVRIIALLDRYDELTRVPSCSALAVRQQIEAEAGGRFEPRLVELLFQLIDN